MKNLIFIILTSILAIGLSVEHNALRGNQLNNSPDDTETSARYLKTGKGSKAVKTGKWAKGGKGSKSLKTPGGKGKGGKGSKVSKSSKFPGGKGKGGKGSKAVKSSKSPGGKGKGGKGNKLKGSKSPGGKGKGGKGSKSSKGPKRSSKSPKLGKKVKKGSNVDTDDEPNPPSNPPSENGDGDNDDEPPTDDIVLCETPAGRRADIVRIARRISGNNEQEYALNWLLNDDTETNACNGEDDVIERYALATFFNATNGADWENNNGWLTKFPICEAWFGVICDNNGRISTVNIRKYNRLELCLICSFFEI